MITLFSQLDERITTLSDRERFDEREPTPNSTNGPESMCSDTKPAPVSAVIGRHLLSASSEKAT